MMFLYSRDAGSTNNGKGQRDNVEQIRVQANTTWIVKQYLPIDYVTRYLRRRGC